jgi:hypothetical protein
MAARDPTLLKGAGPDEPTAGRPLRRTPLGDATGRLSSAGPTHGAKPPLPPPPPTADAWAEGGSGWRWAEPSRGPWRDASFGVRCTTPPKPSSAGGSKAAMTDKPGELRALRLHVSM